MYKIFEEFQTGRDAGMLIYTPYSVTLICSW